MRNILRLLAEINITQNEISSLRSSKIDWIYTLDFFSYHELIPLLYYNLKKINYTLPSEVEDILKQSYYISCAQNIILLSEFYKIRHLFDKNNIIFVPLKGIDFLNSLYPDINLRSISDIDLLVKKDQFKVAEKLILQDGYQKILAGMNRKYWQNYHCHFMYGKKSDSGVNIHLELHWALDFKRIKDIKIEMIFQRSRIIKIKDKALKVLSPEDTLISLILHQRRFNKPLILKNILDAKLLIEDTPDFDWDYIIRNAWKYRLRATLNLFLKELEIFYFYKIKDGIKKSLKIPRAIDTIQSHLIKNSIYNHKLFQKYEHQKKIYFYLYFLFYDTFWESLYYLFFVSEEKFARFFNLVPYKEKTKVFYRMRIIYAPLNFLLKYLNKNRPRKIITELVI